MVEETYDLTVVMPVYNEQDAVEGVVSAKPILELSAFTFGTSPACEMDDHKMYYSKRDLWPLLVKAGFKPSRIRLNYQHAFMTLFAAAIT